MKFTIETGETYESQKTVFGRSVEYYWVRPILPDYDIGCYLSWQERRKVNLAIYEWVEEKFGKRLDWSNPTRSWCASNNTYYFRKAEDRTMFLLRWA